MGSDIGDTSRAGHQRFYAYALVCAGLIVFAGFARTYFLKALFGTPTLYPLLHVHGIVMTSWFLLFGAQTWLVQAHRTDLHRRLGVIGALLASVILAVGAAVVTINAREGRVPPGAPVPVIVALSFGSLLVFGLLVAAGIYFRARSEFHKRLMLLATINLLSAAIQRIPLDFIDSGGLAAVFGLLDLFVVICVVYDTWRHRRLHPAFGWGALLSIVWPVLAILIGGSPGWGR
jgi:FtsH-binding integral membrane protein